MVPPAPSRPNHLLIPVVLNLHVTGTVCFIRTKDFGLKTGAYLLHVAPFLFMRLQPRASQDYRRSTTAATRAGLLKRFCSFAQIADLNSKFSRISRKILPGLGTQKDLENCLILNDRLNQV